MTLFKNRIIIEPPIQDVLVVDDEVSRLEAMKASGVFKGVTPVYAHSALLAIELICAKPWEVLFLDHDLETYMHDPYPREITGQHVVQVLLAQSWRPKLVVVHSMNFGAAKIMEAMLDDAGVEHIRTPVTAFTGWMPSRH